jgi:hypothetical protein
MGSGQAGRLSALAHQGLQGCLGQRKGRGVAVISAQRVGVSPFYLKEAPLNLGAKAWWLDPIDDHGQIGMTCRFDEDALVAIVNIVQLALSAPAKGVLCKVADGGQHATDEVRVLAYSRIAGSVPQQQPRLAMDEEYLLHLKGKSCPQ